MLYFKIVVERFLEGILLLLKVVLFFSFFERLYVIHCLGVFFFAKQSGTKIHDKIL